jgi:hypothetical protein
MFGMENPDKERLYNPEDFSEYRSLCEDMTDFYRLYDKYRVDKSNDVNRMFAVAKLNDLYFTIKHGSSC